MKKFSPFLLVIVVLVLALAALGVGYGYWTQTLDVSGTITTGNLAVGFTSNHSGTCGTSIDGSGALQVTADDVYPGFSCNASFEFENSGTVAVDYVGTITPPTHGTVVWNTGCTADGLVANDTATCSFTYTADMDATADGTNELQNGGAGDSFSIAIVADQFNH